MNKRIETSENDFDKIINHINEGHFHIVITGERHKGKSTLLQRIIKTINPNSIRGFYTDKYSAKYSKQNGVYIHDARYNEREYTEENCVAYSPQDSKGHECSSLIRNTLVFDTYGVSTLKNIADNDLIIMDEIGKLESDAEVFKKCVLNAFECKNNMLAVVKKPSNDFLRSLITHPLNTGVIELFENYTYTFRILG